MKTKKGRKIFNKRMMIIAAVLLIALLAYLHWMEKIEMMKPEVTVTKSVQEKVPLFIDFVGNTAAVKTVDIRARVEGFLTERLFVEGDEVKAGDLLYVIDERPFKAALEQAKGQLAKDEAALKYATEQVERYTPLIKKDFVSKEQYDNLVTTMEQYKAAVEADRGVVDQAKLNLEFCRMYAPFNGRIGRTYYHEGNLVGSIGSDTKLATINQLDPIYVYFSPSDDQIQKISQRAMVEGTLSTSIKFDDGSQYPHKGSVDFFDNSVNNSTSTVAMRAVIPNPDSALLPGMYLSTRLYLGEKQDAVTIPQKAVMSDQGGQYVYIIGEGDKAQKSYVTIDFTYDDKNVISSGVSADDTVAIDGMQMIKPGMPVRIKIQRQPSDSIRNVVKRAISG